MATSAHRTNGKTNGRESQPHAAAIQSYLAQALGTTLDSLAIGVILLAEDAHILYANQAAERMFEARSPIVSIGGCLAALQPDLTKELRRAVRLAQADEASVGVAGIGVPLVDKTMNAATAHVLPLGPAGFGANGGPQPIAAVFVTAASPNAPLDTGTVARSFALTPAEARLLQQLVAGASLNEAAATLGVTESTARTHRNHIFLKTGVSRRTDLVVLVGRLTPPIHRAH